MTPEESKRLDEIVQLIKEVMIKLDAMRPHYGGSPLKRKRSPSSTRISDITSLQI
jgi:hypothetical protein